MRPNLKRVILIPFVVVLFPLLYFLIGMAHIVLLMMRAIMSRDDAARQRHPNAVMVHDLTPERMAEMEKWLLASGVELDWSPKELNRLKAAVQRYAEIQRLIGRLARPVKWVPVRLLKVEMPEPHSVFIVKDERYVIFFKMRWG